MGSGIARGVWAACFAITAGCSYDWTPGPPADAGPGDGAVDASPGMDGASDAPLSNESGGDSSAPVDGSMPEASADVAPPDCATLAAPLRGDRASALQCSPGVSACTVEITDECGCKAVVGDGASTAAANYQAAVMAYATAGCAKPSWCATCATPMTGLCIVSDAGNPYACAQ